MATIFWVFIALTFGFILYSSIQDEIPDEFSFFKLDGPSSQQTTPQNTSSDVKVSHYKGWSIKNDGYSVELSHSLVTSTPAIGPAALARPPELGIICNRGVLDVRLEVGDKPVVGDDSTTFIKVGGISEEWDIGNSTNIFPKLPNKFLSKLKASPSHFITVTYVSHGVQTLTLDTTGLAELLVQLPKSCQ